MDAEAFEKLIQDRPPDVKANGVLLFNALATTRKAYRDDPTSSRKRDWDTAEEALKRFAANLDGDRFGSLAHVLEYLQEQGWKIQKTALYRHHQEGKIRPESDGSFQKKDVDRYAKTFLKQQATGKRVNDQLDEMQRRKLDLERENLELEIKRKTLAYHKEQGLYIPRDRMEMELAGRAAMLESTIKHSFQAHAGDYIHEVDGDIKKAANLINLMTLHLNESINRYATMKEFEFILDLSDEEAPEEE
jgi:uncharacterized coiled-coil protein SlyX